MKQKIFSSIIFLSILCALLGFSQSAQVVKIFLNDKVVSSKARVIDGVIYAPVDDLLKPFDYKGTRKGDRVDLLPISGVAQRDGASGTVGVLVKGKTCSIKVLGVRPVAGYEEEYIEVYGTLTAPAQSHYGLDTAIAVFVGGKQTGYFLSAKEIGGGSYAYLNKAESVDFVVQFKKDPKDEIERVVLTFNNSTNAIKDVFRIRIKE